MRRIIRKIWNTVTTVLVAAAAVLVLLLFGVQLAGIQVFTVQTGSMEPDYPAGSLIYVKAVDHRELREGDVITFLLGENTVATHRIVDIVADEADPAVVHYRTKGDANSMEDRTLVHCNHVIGTPVFTIPMLGYAADYIQNPPGRYLAIAGGIIMVALVLLPELIFFKPDRGGKYLKH